MPALQVGDDAPDFTVPSSGGGEFRLSDLRGRRVILYFYPADDTPGCTTEALQFRAIEPEIRAAGAEVVGISPDTVESHDRFAAKHDLPFTLLADSDHHVAEMYGAWGEKNLYGRKYLGIQRSTYLIDEAGKIAHIWPKVRAKGHADQVLQALTAAGT